MSDYFRFAAGAQLDRVLGAAIAELKAPPASTKPRSEPMPVAIPKATPRGLFFSLIDEVEGSERRLDIMAEPLVRAISELEERAAAVIEEKHTGIARTHDYLDRLQGFVKKLEETKTPGVGDNRGPPTEPGSAASPPPSSDAPVSPPSSSDTPPDLMGLGLLGETPPG